MAYPVLGRSEDALDAEETTGFLRRRLGDGLLATTEEYGTYTVDVAHDAWVDALALCRDEDLLAYDMFDCLFGVDAGEDGFDVVAILYSTSRGRRILLRGRCEGGREAPTFPTATGLFPGADWMERETWDMYGIEFTDHPGLAPRILCVENFEGWPLRKDFFLASRAAKPWPGVKEPAETDEDGNVITRVPGPGEAPGPSVLDELMAGQSRAANPAPEEPVGTAEDDVLPTAPATEAQAEADEDAPAPTEPDHVATDVEDATEQAAVRAEEVRRTQAEARAEKAAEHVDDADDDAPVVPEGTPPADDAAGEEDDA